MKFKTLILENCYSHKHTEIDLSGGGITLITGDNGSGKSSLLKSLLFCLFGIGTDSVVNNIVGNNTCVTLIGSKPTREEFTIRRYRKHSKFKNDLHFFIDGNPVDASTNIDLQKKLEKYLGLDYKSFLNISAFSSEMQQFCAATDVERKAIFEKILQDLDVYNEYYKTAKEEYSVLKVESDELAHQKDIEERELSVVKKVLATEEERALELEVRRKEQIEKLEEELAELNTKFKLSGALKSRREKYKRVVERLDLWLEEHSPLEEEYFKTKQQLDSTEHKLAKLFEKDWCPECNQAITEEYKKQEKIRLEETKSIIIDILIEFEIRRDARQKVVNKFNEINERIEEIRYKLTKYERIEDEIGKKEVEITKVKEALNDNYEAAQQWRSKIKRLSKKIASYQRRIKEAEEEQQYLEEVVKGFSKTGIPNVIISRALLLLEERTNIYLDLLTSGAIGVRLSGFATTKKGAVRNKISIEVISANGVTTYESYSGGERQRLNISMLLALRDVAQANKGINLNCLFLDEVLDLSLDAAGIADVLMLLQHKRKDIDNIFIISPKEELIRNASSNFDYIFKVHKENGFSKIIGG